MCVNVKRKCYTCSLATTDNKITMGFANDINAKPKTLIIGNELDMTKAVNVDFVLRRTNGNEKFDTLIYGGLRQFKTDFPDLITDNIQLI